MKLLSLPLRRQLAKAVAEARKSGREYANWRDVLFSRYAWANNLPDIVPLAEEPDIDAILDQLPAEAFHCLDMPGWTRQFWHAGHRHGLGPATQLFTEPYMAQFLLDNTLGAWWVSRQRVSHDRLVTPAGMPLHFLRWVREGGKWRPAAGTFPQWPDNVDELRLIDPCCGGGIFLLLALPMLIGMGCREPMKILHGLDLDRHCADLTSFTLRAAAGILFSSAGANPRVETPANATGSLYQPDAADGSRAAVLLRQRYHLVLTNTPFLGRGKQDKALADFCRKHYPDADRDLATVFLQRCIELCAEGGTAALVLPQNWLYLKSYRRLRAALLRDHEWNLLARLGEGGFHDIEAAGAFSILFAASRRRPNENSVSCLDASAGYGPDGKIALLRETELTCIPQTNIGAPSEKGATLGATADSRVGVQTGDDSRYLRYFWEMASIHPPWRYIQGTPDPKEEFTGLSQIIRWDESLLHSPGARIQGLEAVGKSGVAVHRLRSIFPYRHTGELFHQNIAVLTPRDPAALAALWCHARSPDYAAALRRLDGKLNITNATLAKPAHDGDAWRAVAARDYPHGLPLPYSNHPCQWIFHGHPTATTEWDPDAKTVRRGAERMDEISLHIAVARLAGYVWPAERDDAMRLAAPQRELVEMARNLSAHADGTGILPLPDLAQRLSALLADCSATAAPDADGLEHWLRNAFFEGHCRLFCQRPFLWHIWDGLADGFAVIVNYHTFDLNGVVRLLERWLREARTKKKLAAGKKLLEALRVILEGRPPCDIYVRWKPAAEQAGEWLPDLDDGVRLNIRPFLSAPDIKLKGAGVLRRRPHIDWRPDRGRDDGAERRNDLHRGDSPNTVRTS